MNTEINSKYYLAFIILVSILLRLNGLEMALPYFHSDGGDVVPVAYNIVKNHDFDYKIYKYGGFYFYLSAIYFYIIFICIWILNWFSIPLKEIINSYSLQSDTTLSLFYFSKYLSFLIGITTIIATYFIAKILFNKKVALLSAFLLAIHPLHILQSQLANVDISLLLWVLLSFYCSIKILNSPNIIYYILSSIFIGLSMSTKYYFFGIFPLLVCHILKNKKDNKINVKSIFNPKMIISIYLIIIVFIVTNPYFVFKLYEIIKKPLQLILSLTLTPRFNNNLLSKLMMGIVYQILFSSIVLNIPIFILFIIGMKNIKIYNVNYFLIFLLSVGIYMILFILIIKYPFPQYLLPILPFVIIICSYYIFEKKYLKNYLNVIKYLLLIFGIIYSLSDIIMPHYRSIINSHLQMGKWIESKNNDGKSVFLPNMLFFSTIYLKQNNNFIYYGKKKTKYYDYLGGIEEKQSDLNTFNSTFITLVNPDYLITFNADYLHSFPTSLSFESDIYFKTINDIEKGKYNYKIIKEISPPDYWMNLAKLIMPMIKNYKFKIYQKTNIYNQDDKIIFINNLFKNKDINKKEIDFLPLYIKDIKNPEKNILKNIINKYR
ncbi:MAG: glycosyltransferase family 39 protein [Proteobacteria bacterium]|nr:glycosyltransferase family 39 protein [Pseudomonadota bacterium]